MNASAAAEGRGAKPSIFGISPNRNDMVYATP